MEELRLKLLEDLNACGLPIEAIMFVVKDVYRDVQEAFRDYQIKKEKMPNKNIKKEEVE